MAHLPVFRVFLQVHSRVLLRCLDIGTNRTWVRYARASRARHQPVLSEERDERKQAIHDPDIAYFWKKHMDTEQDPEGTLEQDEDERETEEPSERDGYLARRSLQRKRLIRKEEPKEPCLLTWSAKQQLRYLHKSDPVDWSPERLAEAFPISLPDVQRLLSHHGNFTPSAERIAQSDEAVMNRWKALKSGKIEGWVTADQRKRFLEGKLTLTSAAGIAALALPQPHASPPLKPPSRIPPGPFTNLIQLLIDQKFEEDKSKYAKALAEVAIKAKSSKVLDTRRHAEGKPFAQNLLPGPDDAWQSQRNDSSHDSVSSSFGLKNDRMSSESDETCEPEYTYPEERVPNRTFKGVEYIIPKSGGPTDVRIRKSVSGRSTRTARFHEDVKLDVVERYRKEDPEKGRIYEKWFEQYENTDSSEQRSATQRKQTNNKETETWVFDNVKSIQRYTDEHRVKVESRREAEEAATPCRIEIPEDKKRQGAVYRKGDTFYDDSGSFLFRIPT